MAKKIKTARDVWLEREEEEKKREMQNVGRNMNRLLMNGTIKLRPSTEKKIKDFIDWDTQRQKEERNRKRKYEYIGLFVWFLILGVIALGSIALIKYLLSYLF